MKPKRGRPRRLGTERPYRTISSPDGTISFNLLARDQVLYVERESVDPAGARRIVAAAFREASDFLRWCEADQARFASPLMYHRTRQAGLEIFARISTATTSG